MLRLIDDIKNYERLGGLEKELERLSLQKFVITQACTRQNQALLALAKLKIHGITEDRLIQLNNFIENTEYKASSYISTK